MFKKIPLSHIFKFYGFHHRMILVLISLMICLLYIQGEHYIHCTSIFPDEIFDLPRSLVPLSGNDEKDIIVEYSKVKQFISIGQLYIPIENHLSQSKRTFLEEKSLFMTSKKRLFLLQQYNS